MRLIAAGGTMMSRHSLLRGLIVLLLAIGIGLAISYRDAIDAASIRQLVAAYGPAAPAAFILIYALATVFFFPGAVLTLIGGAMFGPVWGTLYNLIGATLGASIAFLIARYLAGDWVEHRSGKSLKRFQRGVEQEGWRFVAFVRLVPLFPFNLLNYVLGLTRISLGAYVVASLIFMLPGAIAYTYLGYAGSELLGGGEGLLKKTVIAGSLLLAAGFLPGMVRRMRHSEEELLKDD